MKKLILIALLCTNTAIAAQVDSEVSAKKYFETIKNNPTQLAIFLRAMPKGADLHTHMGGASWAENLIHETKGDGFCIETQSFKVTTSICPKKNLLEHAIIKPDFYNAIIDAWSMRHFQPGNKSGHDHFFATFEKFSPIIKAHKAETITEIKERAAEQNELYVEIMATLDNNASGNLGKQLGWNADFAKMRTALLQQGLNAIVAQMSLQLNEIEAKSSSLLYCGTKLAKPGCQITMRYLYQVLREQAPAAVFAQLLAGFEAANNDQRIVGINMVQPEDGKIAMRDYHLHMRMIRFLHQLYPNVHITLHAGELAPGLVPDNGLRFHIRDAVETANAERIGHGVDIKYEDHAASLLQEMAKHHVLVEINLSSNAAILNVEGKNHPLTLYISHHIPVALSTDDEGILRTNLTEQYEKAVTTYHLSYLQLKTMANNSIMYSFLPGTAKAQLKQKLDKQWLEFENRLLNK